MRPLDIYELGVKLARSASSEAEIRNAIGRMYYGLHHEACCRYFREHPNARPLGRGSRHSQLIARYQALSGVSTGNISRRLRQLARLRAISDYELADRVTFQNRRYTTVELMAMSLRIARGIVLALESFSPGEAPDGCNCPVVHDSGARS